ncbi:MAG: WG repeat-containing protein [Bacteroidales bacterium]|nr:WG repeat-containing protein [Bacteroidales bacterium]
MRNVFLAFTVGTIVLFSSCGRSTVEKIELFPVESSDGRYEYINREGEIIINPQFKYASVFREGLALVKSSNDKPLYGFIDKTGNYVISPIYIEATSFSDGLAWVVAENSAPVAINKKGEHQFTLQQAESVRNFSEELAAFSISNDKGETLWGFVNKKGEIKINAQFKSVRSFTEGLCAVANDNNVWGYIGKDGKYVISNQFDNAESFNGDYAVVYNGHDYGVIDKKGKFIINPQYNEIIIDGDLFLVNQSGKYGWINKSNKYTINAQFDRAFPFNGEKIASVHTGGKYGYINKDGKLVVNPQFELAYPFNNGIAIIKSSDKYGLIDKDGKYVVNPQFEDISLDCLSFLLPSNYYNYYEEAQTDFFDAATIVEPIRFDLSMTATFDELKSTYNITEFSNTSTHELATYNTKFSNAILTTDGKPFKTEYTTKQVQKYDYWYGYYNTTEKVANYIYQGNQQINSYKYTINLHGKAYGKSNTIIDLLKSKLVGYTIDNETNNALTYVNNKQKVSIFWNNSQIVVILKANNEKKNESLDDENKD